MAVHLATSRRVFLGMHYREAISWGSVPSTSGGRYHGVGLDDDFGSSGVRGALSGEMPRVPRNVHPEPESSSGDATSRLVEAIERLVAQNIQQQQPRQQPQPRGIITVVKRFEIYIPSLWIDESISG
ncbi:hypothetical protein FNV43_RR07246 [Rhamnella rubrinervis]|uniref:Uncharacterized protein n=1 Tax=Rhamnella rubrinervis TaxID=2594499 RepID=A0A8K0HG54_9ROSA|nr:hypothetical protein FNV43_RR07246 [Rhamnella rubrinervis]